MVVQSPIFSYGVICCQMYKSKETHVEDRSGYAAWVMGRKGLDSEGVTDGV